MPSVGSSRTRQFRPRHQRSANGKLLLLAAGKIATAPPEHGFQHRKQFEDFRRHIAIAARCSRKAGCQVFADGEQGENLASLRDKCDAGASPIIRRFLSERRPSKLIEPDDSGCCPTMALSMLVLPTPLRPRTQVIEFGFTSATHPARPGRHHNEGRHFQRSAWEERTIPNSFTGQDRPRSRADRC